MAHPVDTGAVPGVVIAGPSSGAAGERSVMSLLPYFVLGIGLGLIFMKAELISWFRIQEMFRFQAFHMYGVLGSAAGVAALSVALLKRFGVSTFGGEPITVAAKKMGKGTRYWAGGLIFGAGWALTGACPGPFFALIGGGLGVFVFVLLCALVGMWTYGRLRPRLPH